ncbi:hypothetical protein F0562_002575 [Nyssa sinensis]|uniref:CUE domain-containing protein n=1 Tax=Nyssa sinensis TaxID=561372 RepID=A0A5J5CB55_9ASTE|nr:hypothetical protein F0562_002575 [Nyssa sinensis]
MGFNSVYRVLQEVFPQVDARILRAVAIEHSKDADAAVEAVLVEVVPYLSKQSMAPSSSNETEVLPDESGAVEGANNSAHSDGSLLAGSTCLDEALIGSSYFDANGVHDQVCGSNGNEEFISLGKREESSVKVEPNMTYHVSSTTLIHENDENVDHNQVRGDTEGEEIISIVKYQESSASLGSDQSSHVTATTSKHGDSGISGSIKSNVCATWKDFDKLAACDSNTAIHGGSHQEQSYLDGILLEVENSAVQLASSSVQEHTPNAPESSLQLVLVPDTLISDCEKLKQSGSFDAAPEKETSICEMVHFEDESTSNAIVTRSGQICRIDLLEDIIEDARSNKKTLFSAMESVISLMREVELQEKAAEQANEEAARGGLDILSRADDIKQMLRHAREANDMHAGEVYGEKAILGTEVRELQSRLLCLSDERDKALGILDEMHQTLEERLAAAEEERKVAEQERLEKEKSARNALAEQELMMEKVVEESKILNHEAEENSKLREFLMDRGRVVDMLQGEISVICQDVKLLKEKFDERVPLSKSLSSSQTSFILASSSSSLKSMPPDQVPELADSSQSPKITSPTASINDQLFSGEEKASEDRKALVDDGWEFFDNREFDI